MMVVLWPRKRLSDRHTITSVLKGFRVYLRPPLMKDWQKWAQTRARNKDFLIPFEPRWHTQSLTRDFFKRRLIKQKKDRDADQGYSFLIFDRHTNGVIGGVNINHVCRGASQSASLGYWIDERHQGKGLMAESLRLIIRYAFDDLGLHRLNAACMPHNKRSIQLLQKLGFTEEGFAGSYVQINDIWEDHILFGLINQSEK